MPKIDNKKELCGAKTSKGTPCKHIAGYGTDHVGTGKCKFHGGASKGAPKGNSNAVKHGLYSKYFPEETLEIFNALENESPIDILRDNIKIQSSAIILAQKKMRTIIDSNMEHEVRDGMILLRRNQKGTSTKKEIDKNSAKMIEEKYQTIAEEYDTYLRSQSRAMATLNGMIKNYMTIVHNDLDVEEQKLRNMG